MLGKLIKYEFRATRNLMLTVYGALLAIAVAFAAVTNISGKFTLGGYMTNPTPLQSVGVILFVAMIYLGMISVVISLICAIKRFRSNILGTQGYLMNTLPVSTGSKVIAKMTVSAVWTIIGYLIFVVSIAIGAFSVFKSIDGLLLPKDISVDADNILMLIMLLINIFKLYLMIYASMAIGYSFNKWRKFLSVASFVGLIIVDKIIDVVLLEVIPLDFLVWAQPVLNVLIGIGVYFLTVYFLEHRLNLE